jgi:hypothetical protein
MIRSLLEQYTERFDTEREIQRTGRIARSEAFVKKDKKVTAKKRTFKSYLVI